MANFLQLHLLTAYGPSNLNRDDTGKPKTVVFGGVSRLRVSSQSLKRAWRTSDVFASTLANMLGDRTRRVGHIAQQYLDEGKVEASEKIARAIARVFGTVKIRSQEDGDDSGPRHDTEQLVFVTPQENKNIRQLAEKVAKDKKLAAEIVKAEDEIVAANSEVAKKKTGALVKKLNENISLLCTVDTCADVAMFGRMLADAPKFNREAAVQVAHAVTTHRAVAEDDYYTAVDDLKSRDEPDDAGAGFVGVQEFGAGVFYLYVCVDRDLLLQNLGENQAVQNASLGALVEAAATVAPGGKQASFASRARAFYVLGEKGSAQPRSLAAAFLKPVTGADQGADSVTALESFRDRLDTAYGQCADNRYTMNVATGEGTLRDLIAFSMS